MKRFADALAWHMQAIASDYAGLVVHPQPHGGFHLTTVPASDNVMQGKFTGLTVAVTHMQRGEEHLLRVTYSLESEEVVANLWPEFESRPSRQLAEVLLRRFLDTCARPAPQPASAGSL